MITRRRPLHLPVPTLRISLREVSFKCQTKLQKR